MIKIARIDSEKNFEFVKSEGLREYDDPTIWVFHEGTFYSYDNSLGSIKHFLAFLNKIMVPLVQLKSENEVYDFMALDKFVDNNKLYKNVPHLMLTQTEMSVYKYVTRVLVLIFDKNDYDEELNDIRAGIRFISNRVDLRAGLVTDKKVLKKIKKETNWFENESSFTSLVVKRYDGNIEIVDLMNTEKLTQIKTPFTNKESKNEKLGAINNYSVFINKHSLKLIEPLNS